MPMKSNTKNPSHSLSQPSPFRIIMIAGVLAIAVGFVVLSSLGAGYGMTSQYLSPKKENKLITDNYAKNPLHDQTVTWLPNVDRMWLKQPSKGSFPPAMLLLTNFGWNNPNQTSGLETFRGLRSRELLDGIVNHPWFHPTAWEDINEGRMAIDNNTRYYVFLDQETCTEKNYPRYGYGFLANADNQDERGTCCRQHAGIEEVMNTTLMKDANNALFVAFDCGGWGPSSMLAKRQMYTEVLGKNKMAIVSLSTRNIDASNVDQGLVPPAGRPCDPSEEQRRNILTCNETNRTLLLTFSGVFRSEVRKALKELNNGVDVVIGLGGYARTFTGESDPGRAYHNLLTRSIFGAAPRGDNLFSYRFTESMSCGAIPVVYADDWQLPFGPELINWSDTAVIIPEVDANRSLEILRAIPAEQRCRMRQNSLDFYDRYAATGYKVIEGVIEVFERKANGK